MSYFNPVLSRLRAEQNIYKLPAINFCTTHDRCRMSILTSWCGQLSKTPGSVSMLTTTEAAIRLANARHLSVLDLLSSAKSETPLMTVHSRPVSAVAVYSPRKTFIRTQLQFLGAYDNREIVCKCKFFIKIITLRSKLRFCYNR